MTPNMLSILYLLSAITALLLLWIFQPHRYAAWSVLAWLATRKPVTVWLMRRAFRTPYSHITSADGTDVYMRRFWLFNPYVSEDGARASGSDAAPRRSWWREMLPSVRLHHIMLADQDRHLHDHPWNARTIILKGWYEEERYFNETPLGEVRRQLKAQGGHVAAGGRVQQVRIAGYTGRLLYGQYHRITAVPRDGVWTLFITWRKRGGWGFDVDGVKVPWREYLHTHACVTKMAKDIADLPIQMHNPPMPDE